MLVDAAAMPSGAASAADTRYLTEALKEAQRAADAGEVPVGAVIMLGDRIIARGHNQTEQLTDATAHAEMICLTAAMAHLRSKYLPDCALYVTLEPCVMCAGALRWAQGAAAGARRGTRHRRGPAARWPRAQRRRTRRW